MDSIESLTLSYFGVMWDFFVSFQNRKKEGGKEPMDVDKKTRLEPFSFPDGQILDDLE